jgi:bifunctional DNase/RNase
VSDIECAVDSVKVLPIWIHPEQAHAIATRLSGQISERPLTHDFVIDAFGKLGAEVVGVAVTGLLP